MKLTTVFEKYGPLLAVSASVVPAGNVVCDVALLDPVTFASPE